MCGKTNHSPGDSRRGRNRWAATLLVVCVQILATNGFALSLERGPYLQQATPSSMIVRWRTDLASETTLRHGPAPNYLSTVLTNPALTTEHEVQITNLQPATKYYYSVGEAVQVLAGGDADHFFVTSNLINRAEMDIVHVNWATLPSVPMTRKVDKRHFQR